MAETVLAVYVAALLTFYQINQERKYFERREEWLLSVRMISSLFWTLMLPGLFGLFDFACVTGFRSGGRLDSPWLFAANPSTISLFASVGTIIFFTLLPFGFSQTWLLVGRHWDDQLDYIKTGNPWFWKFCFVLILGPVGLAGLIWYSPQLFRLIQK